MSKCENLNQVAESMEITPVTVGELVDAVVELGNTPNFLCAMMITLASSQSYLMIF